MLDDHRRKAVAAVRDFGHRASLSLASLAGYPVILTSPVTPSRATPTRLSVRNSPFLSIEVVAKFGAGATSIAPKRQRKGWMYRGSCHDARLANKAEQI